MRRRGQPKVREMLQKMKTVSVLHTTGYFRKKVSCIVVCCVVLYGEVSSHQMGIAGYNDSMGE